MRQPLKKTIFPDFRTQIIVQLFSLRLLEYR